MGYGEETKGYRLYAPEKRKVKFNENKAQQESADSDTAYCMELDFSDNTEMSSEVPVEEQSEIVPRRSERQRQPPDFYGARLYLSNETSSEPMTIEEATACSEKSEWMRAMETERK